MVNHGSGISSQTAHGTAQMLVNLDKLFNRRGDHQGACDAFLNGKHDAVRGLDSNGGGAELWNEIGIDKWARIGMYSRVRGEWDE